MTSLAAVAREFPAIADKVTGIAFKQSPTDPGGRLLEFYAVGEPDSFDPSRPAVEVFGSAATTLDVAGDIVSHYLGRGADVYLTAAYNRFVASLTSSEEAILHDQYDYAVDNEGETRPYATWRDITGIPAYFRGYAFQQWAVVFSDYYTPEQLASFDQMMAWLRTPRFVPPLPFPAPGPDPSPSGFHDQRGLLSAGGIDLSALRLITAAAPDVDVVEAIVNGDVDRTIEGASTVKIEIFDRDRALLRSDSLWSNTIDVKLDGLWFRLTDRNKDGETLELVFEDREVAKLRGHNSKLVRTVEQLGGQDKARPMFAKLMLDEEPQIRFRCPALDGVVDTGPPRPTATDPDEQQQARVPGFGPHEAIKVKGQFATPLQKDNLAQVLATGVSMGLAATALGRRLLIAAVMTVTAESNATNLVGGDWDSRGIFQQRVTGGRPDGKGGWPATRDIPTDAHAFFEVAQWAQSTKPYLALGALCSEVQRDHYWNTGRMGSQYAEWEAEATHTVEAYLGDLNETVNQDLLDHLGGTSQDTKTPIDLGLLDSNVHQFTRGIPTTRHRKQIWKREDTWECLGRLADEVAWRRFCSAGTVTFSDEPSLFRTQPIMAISESTDGVESIDFDSSKLKSSWQMTVTCRIGRWQAPPGSVVAVFGMGKLLSGRWLVSSVKRPIFSTLATITLRKPRPPLPESQSPENQTPDGSGGGVTLPPKPVPTPVPVGTAQALAKRILTYAAQGRYRDDDGQQLSQLRKVAAGQALHNQCGADVAMDASPLQGILVLLDSGFNVGTFSLVEDHPCNVDGTFRVSRHSLGFAVDISSLGKPGLPWYALNAASATATSLAKEAMVTLRAASPNQVICNGVGGYDATVQALQLDGGKPRGGVWVSDHTNHIHAGW